MNTAPRRANVLKPQRMPPTAGFHFELESMDKALYLARTLRFPSSIHALSRVPKGVYVFAFNNFLIQVTRLMQLTIVSGREHSLIYQFAL